MRDEYYFSVTCSACGATVPVLKDRSNGKGRFIGPCVVHVRCPACGTAGEYARKLVKSARLREQSGGD